MSLEVDVRSFVNQGEYRKQFPSLNTLLTPTMDKARFTRVYFFFYTGQNLCRESVRSTVYEDGCLRAKIFFQAAHCLSDARYEKYVCERSIPHPFKDLCVLVHNASIFCCSVVLSSKTELWQE